MALSDNIRMAWIRVIDKTKSSATHRGECSSKFLFIFGIGAIDAEGTEFGTRNTRSIADYGRRRCRGWVERVDLPR
jgi:hypothetical protein